MNIVKDHRRADALRERIANLKIKIYSGLKQYANVRKILELKISKEDDLEKKMDYKIECAMANLDSHKIIDELKSILPQIENKLQTKKAKCLFQISKAQVSLEKYSSAIQEHVRQT